MGRRIGRCMGRFHGYRTCATCAVTCTPLNFVDFEGKRFCVACWTEANNPDHPDIDALRQRCAAAPEEWKCLRWTRQQGPLPNGPLSIRRD